MKDEIGFDIILHEVTFKEFTISSHNVEELSESDEATLQVEFSTAFNVEVTYEDYSMAYYDKEDDKYYGSESTTDTVDFEKTYKAEIVFSVESFDPEDVAQVDIECTSVEAPSEHDVSTELPGYVFQL